MNEKNSYHEHALHDTNLAFNAALRAGMTTRWIKIENAHAESTELLLFFVKRIVY